jgi:hypothetical protein
MTPVLSIEFAGIPFLLLSSFNMTSLFQFEFRSGYLYLAGRGIYIADSDGHDNTLRGLFVPEPVSHVFDALPGIFRVSGYTIQPPSQRGRW